MSADRDIAYGNRPSGELHLMIANIFLLFGGCAVLAGFVLDVFPVLLAGGALISSASFLWLIGQLQKAIYFLPRRAQAVEDQVE